MDIPAFENGTPQILTVPKAHRHRERLYEGGKGKRLIVRSQKIVYFVMPLFPKYSGKLVCFNVNCLPSGK